MSFETWTLITKLLFYSVSVYFVVCYCICSFFIHLDNSTILKQWHNFINAPTFFKFLIPSYLFYRRMGKFDMDIRSAITPIFSSIAFAGRYNINELVEQLSWCIKPIHGHEINLRFEEDEKREVFGVTIYCLDESGMDVYSESVFREIAFIDAIIKWNTLLRNKCLTR